MKTIPLTQGQVALVDDEDFDRVNQYKWCVNQFPTTEYAMRRYDRGEKWVNQKMHHFILGSNASVDHRDGDGLNNQKSNLRKANKSQNGMNRRVQAHSSPYKGVTFMRDRNRWKARGVLNKKTVEIGTYNSPELAALAYDTFAQAFYGQFAKTNQQLGAL